MEVVNSNNNNHHCYSNNSNSSNLTQNWGDAYCDCGEKAPWRTSKINSYPGRRFLGCVNSEEENACNFFIWVDPPTCRRGLEYGRNLENKVKEL
ncbi:hypothetical protein RHMOL_Rhmol02G0154800 [Rhododendron molle]|uniref:Uncharacterized protein n=2 Tax=Rhododendron molle TaxID=49168 RepID=A0ACC0PT55_RHOML|nr:hypothetical protein RHMOL_Rhmol09G0131700 [Rhododendron molle]KAI8567867.1 hypothetical protein RHMOL_Rhmol02G0154800 [Rhododendron molle]